MVLPGRSESRVARALSRQRRGVDALPSAAGGVGLGSLIMVSVIVPVSDDESSDALRSKLRRRCWASLLGFFTTSRARDTDCVACYAKN